MEVKVIKADSTQEFERRLNELYAEGWRCPSHTFTLPSGTYTAILERRLEAKSVLEATYPVELKLVS